MKYVFIAILLIFGLLFTSSSGILKEIAFASHDRNNYYYQEDSMQEYQEYYFQGYSKDYLYELDHEEFLEGIDKEMLLDTTLNLLEELDFNKLNGQLLQDSELNQGSHFWITILTTDIPFLIIILFIFLNSQG